MDRGNIPILKRFPPPRYSLTLKIVNTAYILGDEPDAVGSLSSSTIDIANTRVVDYMGLCPPMYVLLLVQTRLSSPYIQI